jgi:hypothetical protein
MMTQSMNHQQALETMATERYLLREMTPEERRLFEEHYLECAECLEAVTFGTEFLEAGHEVAVKQKNALAPTSVPTWRERLLPVLAGWLRPAPALALALLLCFIGLNLYQFNVVREQKNLIAELKAPRQEFRFTVTGEARGGSSDQKIITVPRNTQLSIRVEFAPGEEFMPYRADILGHDNGVKYSLPLSVGPTDDSVSFSIPAEALGPGDYDLVIRRQSRNGSSKDLEKRFVLKFAD